MDSTRTDAILESPCRMTSILVIPHDWAKFRALSLEEGRSASDVIRELIASYIRKRESRQKRG